MRTEFTPKTLSDFYLGVPFKHRGRTVEEGLDCWGLVIDVYRRTFGVEVRDLDNYEPRWSRNEKNLFVENYYKSWNKVDKPQFLDVVLFKIRANVPNHAGIYLTGGRFLQSVTDIGVVTSELEDRYNKALVGAYRYDINARQY